MTNQRKKIITIAIAVTAAVIVLVIIGVLVRKYTASKEIMELSEYLAVKEGEAALILQNEVSEETALYENGHIYVGIDLIQSKFNSRFYWDAKQNVLIYTTPSKVIKAEAGEKKYSENKSTVDVDYPIVKVDEDSVYVALDYVKEFSNIQYEVYEKPVRAVISYIWNKDYLYADTKGETELRFEPDIKSAILVKLKKGEKLELLDTDEKVKGKFVKAMTESGIVGYVKKKKLTEGKYVTAKSEYKAEKYSHINIGEPVNMVWHQVTNQEANESLLNLLAPTKGVNVVAPTWFYVSSNKGNIASLASDTYVERAHNAGVQVWALCSDFDNDSDDSNNVNMLKLLSSTSSREKLEKELIAAAIKHGLDGINIDFENITSEAGPHFIQFVRELSIKCRNNDIVLSIDNYPPTEYTDYYNRREQGEVADYVITMAYDEHYSSSEESGSVASIGFVENAVKDTIEQVEPSQVIIGLPFYTRLWKENKGGGKPESAAYSMTSAANLITDYNAEAEWDEETQQYYAEWKDGDVKCRIWLEEEESLEAKLKVASEGKVAGYAFWKLGLEKPVVWDKIIKYTN